MFIIYVNELPEIVNSATNIFADDTSIYAIGETLSEITSRLQNAVNTPIIMNQTELEVVKSHKHLGVILSNDLKRTKHIDHIHTKSNKTLGMINAASHKMPRKYLDKGYSTIVRPTLEYAGPLWAGLRVQDADRLESIQHQAGRVTTGAMKFFPKEKV